MSAVDDYVRRKYTIIDGEDFSKYPYHQGWYDKMDAKLKSYAKEQMNAGAKLCITHPSANTIDLIYPTKTRDGQTCYIVQGLYNDPRNNTFIVCSIKNEHVLDINRTRECSGYDITDAGNIMKRALVCGKCGEPVDRFEELNFVLYAGAECDKCSGKTWDYINSKPSGYWTE